MNQLWDEAKQDAVIVAAIRLSILECLKASDPNKLLLYIVSAHASDVDAE
jgi:hypothetical protein